MKTIHYWSFRIVIAFVIAFGVSACYTSRNTNLIRYRVYDKEAHDVYMCDDSTVIYVFTKNKIEFSDVSAIKKVEETSGNGSAAVPPDLAFQMFGFFAIPLYIASVGDVDSDSKRITDLDYMKIEKCKNVRWDWDDVLSMHRYAFNPIDIIDKKYYNADYKEKNINNNL